MAKTFPAYWEMGRAVKTSFFGVFQSDESGNKIVRPGAVVDGKWEALDEEAITEDVGCSWFSSGSGLHPSKGETVPAPGRSGAYSWIKAPRYRGHPMEVGALARVWVNYHDPSGAWMKKEVDEVLGALKLEPAKLMSVLGRHAARGLETRWLARQCSQWLGELELDGPPAREFSIPKTGCGYGLTEAPHSAPRHWLSIEDFRIKRYQSIVPTTWNGSPRDDRGQAGPIEQALEGTLVETRPSPWRWPESSGHSIPASRALSTNRSRDKEAYMHHYSRRQLLKFGASSPPAWVWPASRPRFWPRGWTISRAAKPRSSGCRACPAPVARSRS